MIAGRAEYKSTRGCPIYSTINGIDGWEDGSDSALPVRAIQNAEGEWVEKFNEGYDQYFHLTDDETGKPYSNRYYRMTCNGQVIEGKTDANGKTAKVVADDPADVKIEIFPEGHTGSSA